jgi:hypothetical protein
MVSIIAAWIYCLVETLPFSYQKTLLSQVGGQASVGIHLIRLRWRSIISVRQADGKR